ncbi:MAG TPA: SDR family oxidoreductase [Hyphomonadaceae bacterium]|nr:SDR family oxidoreductase [Hyphomonadaceae bacterium]
MRVLVVGAYGLIGLEVIQALLRAGHQVVGFGRSPETGRRIAPHIPWNHGDMRRMQAAADWLPSLSGIDAVVNAAGALQDGAKDDLKLVQDGAIRALVAACEAAGVKRFVQISAPGAEAGARTAFLSTKAAGDAAVRGSKLDWTILKPGLVISAGAYGATALLRMLAAAPVVQPIALADASVQTVAGSDVGEAVRAVLAGEVASRRDYELVEDEVHTLEGMLKAVRRWVGRDDALAVWRLPRWMAFGVGSFADIGGRMGWRSPLRTTALRSLADGVTGDAGPWREAGGFQLKSLEETLRALPSTMQERVFGRTQLVFPVLLLILSAFWLASGVIGIVQRGQAEAVIAARVGSDVATWLVVSGIVLDLAIGWGLLWRKWTRRAAWGSVLVSLGYLAAGTVVTPELWADPLGPFVKVFPAIALALAVAALVEER